MLDAPEIVQTAVLRTAVIRLTVAREEMPRVVGPGIGEVTATVAAQGIAPAGPWLIHPLRVDPATWRTQLDQPLAR